ncbi:uncharacterized protein [Dermacentor albipictus]|uniref:uncharacterized protein n=1 Tax=Dermacentor albipictus TaxID=60249 RepID=UPI0038FCC562
MQLRGLLLRFRGVPGCGQVCIGAATLHCFTTSGFPLRLWLHCQNINMVGRGSTHKAEQVATWRFTEEDGPVIIQVSRPAAPLPCSTLERRTQPRGVEELQRPSLGDAAAHKAPRREENARPWNGRVCCSREPLHSIYSCTVVEVKRLKRKGRRTTKDVSERGPNVC